MTITAIKGFNDILPSETSRWQYIENIAKSVFETHGFSEIRVPIAEKTELFCRSIGDTTDIVEKEMYSFVDKGGNSITLRPEGTAGVMRGYVEHKLYAQDPLAKLYYSGAMFRYERPQKGRYRQFHQIGAEMTGVTSPVADAEVLLMVTSLFKKLGLDEPTLQINSLGCPDCRPDYRKKLVAYLETKKDELCEDCKRRIETNPLRALDCKVPSCIDATSEAPSMIESLCNPCTLHFSTLQNLLQVSGTEYKINKKMVRGLDYYTRTTFEMVTTLLGAQSAVAAGGRYDNLISQIGGPAIPGIGFAMGVERVALLLAERDFAKYPDIFIASIGEAPQMAAFKLMKELSDKGFRVEIDYEGKSLKSQLRRGDKLNSRFSLVIGEDEINNKLGYLKRMKDGSQIKVTLEADKIAEALKS